MKYILILYIFSITLVGCKSLDPNRVRVYEEVTNQVLKDTLPNLEIGIAGISNSNTIQIWYELIKTPLDSVKGTVIFIEGLEGTAMGWGAYTYQPLLDAGYNVIRLDNRDVGRSTWTQNIDYNLSDMAHDVLTVMNDLSVDAVHLVGQSMGGMIAQEFALTYPEKVLTLTLIYSSGDINDKALKSTSKDFIKAVIAANKEFKEKDVASKIKLELAIMDASNGVLLTQEDLLFVAKRSRFEIEQRKGKNNNAFKTQQKAIMLSGSRYERLTEIKMPTLIVHGEKDPLINIEHGKKLAQYIPHAKTLWVNDYGHNLPIGFSKIVMDKLLEMMK